MSVSRITISCIASCMALFVLPKAAFAYMGGKSLSPRQVPGSVRFSIPSCGATKISERHFLTAAHCFALNETSTTVLAYFQSGRKTQLDSGAGTASASLTLREITIHPDWVQPELDRQIDLAIVEVQEASPFPTAKIYTAPLAISQPVVVGGFGCRRWGGGALPLMFGALKKILGITPTAFDVSLSDAVGAARSMTCAGDSGSGAFVRGAGGYPEIAAVVTGLFNGSVDIDEAGKVVAIQNAPVGRYTRLGGVSGTNGVPVLQWIGALTR